MAPEFKPVRFFVLIGLAAFVVCGVAVFYTHRSAHGRTAEERATDAELNMTAQKYFKQQGSGEQLRSPSREGELQAWHLSFEKGYTDGFKKTHPQQ